MIANPLKNSARNFQEFASEINRYIGDYYPEMVPFFSDNTVGQILFESQAAVAANLSFQLERTFQETRLDYAQQRANLFTLAKNAGVKLPNIVPSVTVVDFTVDVPVRGDGFADEYLPVVKAGTQAVGSGQIFEVAEDIDFSSEISSRGLPNRRYRPIVDAQNNVVRYEVTKREILFSGSTKVFRKPIPQASDFLSLVLPDSNVVSVEDVAIVAGLDTPPTIPISDFRNPSLAWSQVDYLAQSKVFVPFGSANPDGTLKGRWEDVDRKYMYEFTPSGRCRLVFGNGRGRLNDFSTVLSGENFLNEIVRGVMQNNSLGVRVPSNSTIYVRYRVSSGSDANLPANTINNLGFVDIRVGGSNQTLNQEVSRTLRATNPTPAIGGSSAPTEEQIRAMVAFSRKACDSAVTLRDYIYYARQMDGRFGRPAKVSAATVNNKVVLYILGIGTDGKYVKDTENALKSNMARYLSEKRMVNDFLEITDAKIINIRLRLGILVDNASQDSTLVGQIRDAVASIFSSDALSLGEDVFLGRIYREVNSIPGVVNLNTLDVFNMVDPAGQSYSSDRPSLMGSEKVSGPASIERYELSLSDNALALADNEIAEIKDTEADILIDYKKRIF